MTDKPVKRKYRVRFLNYKGQLLLKALKEQLKKYRERSTPIK